ncbi:glycoside hydrolase, 17 [Zygosaccharomyces mellis]|uniref:Glycoside hydrolase, 17 n=1 Tax=Zygosaccharomyces mellis TaxID=42258 RepID=A0A4C2E0A9_9SACH|nr:glycoside hydrolase, 17 [Zygosaccharomyces mellis]
MRLTNLIATTSMIAGAAFAAPAAAPGEGHQHHKDRRDIVTNTVMKEVTVAVTGAQGPTTLSQPSSGSSVAPITPSDSYSRVAPLPTSMVVDSSSESSAASSSSDSSAPSSSAAPSTTSESVSSSQAPSSASSSSSAPSASSTGGGSGTSGNAGSSGFKGITYTPYNSDGSCKSTSQVKSDLEQLEGYPVLRLYGTDCNQVANVLQAKSDSQKVFLGIYYVDNISDGVQTISDAVKQYGSWDDVVTVSVGNELVNGGQAVPSQVGKYIDEGRSQLQSAGYNGDVVSVDTFIAVINNPELCKYSDYMAVNAHAFFDKATPAEKAGSWLLQQIQRVYEACNGQKNVIVVESGWPSQGEIYGEAVPSKSNQKAAIEDIANVCGDDTYVFTAFNDLWKPDGAYGVEKWFGVMSSD